MIMRWILVLLFLFVLVNGQSNSTVGNGAALKQREVVSFYVMGDGPYGSKGRKMFVDQLQRLEKRPEFLVHLGDVHEREKNCNLGHFDTPADDLLHQVKVPTFVLPGETDWYECNGQAAAWNKWSERFMKFHEHWPHYLDVRHQESRPENFAFTHKGVLFIGLHVLYATVQDWGIWNKLVHDDTIWFEEQVNTYAYSKDVGAIVLLCHAYAHPRRYQEFYDSFVLHAKALEKPVLYLHGDEHNFLVDRLFPASNILRVVVDEAKESDPMEVTIDAFAAVPFKFKRRATG